MASITRRVTTKGVEVFRVGWRENGQLRWAPTIKTAEGAAEMKALVERIGPAAALAVLRQRSGRDVAEQSVPLLRDYLEHHLGLLASNVTPGTVDDYRRMAARTWLERLGPLPLDAITRELVEEWVAWQRVQPTRRGETYSTKSIKNAHGLLSDTLSRAVAARLIVRNEARGVKMPDDEAEHEMEVLTEDEWLALRAELGDHWVPLTTFLLTVGCRIGEATAVMVRDIDLKRGTVRLRRAWKKGEHDSRYLGSTKSKRGVRTVLMGPAVVEAMRPLVEGRPAGDLVFTAPRGGRVYAQHYRNRVWAPALERAGITKAVTPHSLRHTSASWLLAEGVSPITVQHRLGHESLSTTSKVYAHLLTDAQVGAAAVMERAMPRPQIES